MADRFPSAADPPKLVSEAAGPAREVTAAARALGLLERVFLVAGVILFVVLVQQLGVASVGENLRLVGWGFALILGQEILAHTANTLGWRRAFPPPRRRIRFRRLLAARIAGDAINYVTPTATLGGEFVRARHLHGHVDTTAVLASVAIAKVSQTAAQIAFVIVGLIIVLDDTPLPAGIQQGLLAGLALFSTALATGLILQRRGMFRVGIRLLSRLGFPVPARVGGRLLRLDGEIGRFYAKPLSFLTSSVCFFAGWTVGVVEMYLILFFLGVPADWHRALTIEVFAVAIEGLLFFVPAKMGTQEGSKVLIFTILGLDPAKGLSLGIVRRIRELSWALLGLLILSRRHARKETRGS